MYTLSARMNETKRLKRVCTLFCESSHHKRGRKTKAKPHLCTCTHVPMVSRSTERSGELLLKTETNNEKCLQCCVFSSSQYLNSLPLKNQNIFSSLVVPFWCCFLFSSLFFSFLLFSLSLSAFLLSIDRSMFGE